MTLKIAVKKRREYLLSFGETDFPCVTPVTFIQGPFPFKYRITRLYHINAFGVGSLIVFYVLVSRNRTGSTTVVPEGDNVLGKFGSQPFLASVDGSVNLDVPVDYVVDELNTYIKVHVVSPPGPAWPALLLVKIEEMD